MKVNAILAVFILICSAISFIRGDLVSSSYPINRANPQRNNHINRPILCSAISNGKTTVLQREKILGGYYFPYYIPPVLDDKNYLYSQVDHSTAVKVDLAIFNITNGFAFDDAHITVGTSNLYLSSAVTTEIRRKSDFQQQASISNTGGDGESSLVPYLSDIMIRAHIGEPYTSTLPSYSFLNTTTQLFASTLTSPSVGSPRDAIVYKTNTLEFPIFIGQFSDGSSVPTVMISAGPGRYSVNITNAGLLYKHDPFVVDDKLYVFTDTSMIYQYNAETGQFLQSSSWKLFGDTNLINSAMIKGSKALGSLEITDTEQKVIVDLTNNITVLSDLEFTGHPVFSSSDNVVLMSVADAVGNVNLMGLDWNDWSLKVVGNVGTPGNLVTSEPVIGDDCTVYMIVDGDLHMYKPLPLQNVVPVIECIEPDNTAYFSYENLEPRSFNIPLTADRNNLYPMGLTPVTSFEVGSGPHYPLGPSVVLTGTPSGSYKWILEDYTLEFAITPALSCPKNITLGLKFTASSSFDVSSFSNIVRTAFLNVTGIRDTRVGLGNVTSFSQSTKRSVRQNGDSSLEVELQVGPGNPNEPSPSNVVTNFVTNQQTDFNTQVSNDPNAPPNVNLTSINTKQPETAQRGVPNPAPITTEPVPNIPQSIPVASLGNVFYASNQALVILFSVILLMLK